MKNNTVKICALALLVASVLVANGCAKKINRCVLSGAVTSDGQAVPSGTIQFIPENPDPKLQVAGGAADIVDGQYSLTPGTGLVAGKYKVRVIATAFRDKKTGELVDPNDMKDGLVNPLSVVDEDLVPPKFGAESEQYVEIGNEKTKTYDINMVKE